MIENKVKKGVNGFYGDFKEFGLYIFTKDDMTPDDLLAAMEAALNSLEEGSIVVDRKGKPINPQDLIRVVEEAAGKVKIGERSPKFPNQEARQWSVEGANSDVDHKKGVVFLGKDGAELKPGEYVSVDELMAAIAEYVIMTNVLGAVAKFVDDTIYKVFGGNGFSDISQTGPFPG